MRFQKLTIAALTFLSATILSASAQPNVTISETEKYTLANGIVTVQVGKHSGDLTSLKYNA